MPAPQKFTSPKPLETLLETIRANGWRLSTEKFDRNGDDYINFDFHHDVNRYFIVYNTFNGTFIARKKHRVANLPYGDLFTEESPLDGTPWYDTLLQFLYQ